MSSISPEIVIEVLSESNTAAETEETRRLYFEEGAEEVWTYESGGAITFYDADGKIEQSALGPSFPVHID